MKKIAQTVGIALVALITFFAVDRYFEPNVEAQRSAQIMFDYAAVTGAYVPYTSDNPSANFVAAVNICYMRGDGCQNEEVRGEVNYSKFLQDSRQENTQAARKFAQNKATETAFAKAFAKLGVQGFEMVSSPGLQFDQYVPNAAGTFTVQEGNSERTADIYFRRQR
jgi:hypothetical protein